MLESTSDFGKVRLILVTSLKLGFNFLFQKKLIKYFQFE